MRSSYKKLGQFISEANFKNEKLQTTTLLGVNVSKEMMDSKANLVGTDLTKYKKVSKGQFVYGPVTSRNGDRIAIALCEVSECIVSTSYTVFKIDNEDELLPEYLMMWFRRPEFDRYARFKSHGSVREIFGWDEMCDVELPIPPIEKQREIVREYHTIVDRIKLNEQLNQKLEETARAIYKQWFEDFEFPISKECAASIGRPDLEGKPYKSSGAPMIWNDKLERDIPEKWSISSLSKVMTLKNGKSRPCSNGKIPVFGGNGVLGYTDDYNNEDVIVIGRVGAYCGSIFRVPDKCWVSDNAICATSLKRQNMFCFYTLKSLSLNEKSEGTGQPLLTQGILNNLTICVPLMELINSFELLATVIFSNLLLFQRERQVLEKLNLCMLSRMSIST